MVHFFLISLLASYQATFAEHGTQLQFTLEVMTARIEMQGDSDPLIETLEADEDPLNAPRPGLAELVPQDDSLESTPDELVEVPTPPVIPDQSLREIAVMQREHTAEVVARIHAQSHDHVEHDEIVNRFIEYDLGRLADPNAKRGFERLGLEALPSLVRGLNKSASISGSCPVVVISTRMKGMLLLSGDADQLEYAIDQIGRGVPEDAIHMNRLLDMKESLERKIADSIADPDPTVSEAAYRYLVNKADGLDLGGGPGSSLQDRRQAVYDWRQWLLTRRVPDHLAQVSTDASESLPAGAP